MGENLKNDIIVKLDGMSEKVACIEVRSPGDRGRVSCQVRGKGQRTSC